MESHQQQVTSTNLISEDKVLTFGEIKLKVGSLLGSGLTSKVYKAEKLLSPPLNMELEDPPVINDE